MQQRKRLKRRMLSVLLTLAMVVSTFTGIVPGTSLTALAEWIGGDYTVTADEIINGNYSVSENATLTINSGVTLTVKGTLSIESGATLTVAGGGNLVVTPTDSASKAIVGDGIGNCGALIVDGAYVEAAAGDGTSQCIGIDCAVTVNGGFLRAKGGAGNYNNSGINGNVTVNSGTVTATGGTGDNRGIVGNVTVNGGELWATAGNDTSQGINGTISGYAEESADGNTWTAVEGSASNKKYVKVTPPPPPVAQIGDDTYTTIDSALAAWDDGETLTLLADVEKTKTVSIAGKNVTLDLNGHTFAYGYYMDSLFKVESGGELTLKDSGEGGALVPATPNDYITGVNVDSGDFTMVSGTISGFNDKGVYVNDGCTFRMSGGTITGCRSGVIDSGSFSVSGAPKVTGNTVFNASIGGEAKITVGELTSGASIGIKLANDTGVFTKGIADTETANTYKNYFTSDSTAFRVKVDSETHQLMLGMAPVSYIDHGTDGTVKDGSCDSYLEINSDNYSIYNDSGITLGPDEAGEWIVIDGEVSFTNRITVSGTANIILKDSATLDASKGITVTGENKLNIYAQSEGEDMGKLRITSVSGNDSGIGGISIDGSPSSCGETNIHGGIVYASGSMRGAGIGGCWKGAGGTVNIYSGTVTAIGNSDAAGIGAGIDGTDNGTLTVKNTNLAVYGSDTSLDSAEVYTEYETTRYKYMKVAEPPVTTYNLWVGGTQVTSANANDIPAADGTKSGTASYDATTNTLTLNGYSYSGKGYGGSASGAIYCNGGGDTLTISLSGTNSLTISGSASLYKCAICAEGGVATLAITGDGSLTCTGDSGNESYNYGYGISASNLIINSGNVVAVGGAKAISGSVKNAISGTGWTDMEGTEGQASIEISDVGQTLDYKKVQFPAAAIAVTDVTLDKYEIAISLGGTTTLTATIAPDDATNRKVKWRVSNASGEVALYSDEACTDPVVLNTATDLLTVYVKGVSAGSTSGIKIDVDSASGSYVHDSCYVTVTKEIAVPAAVTANNRTYDGTEKPLVTVTGEPTGGTMYYALGENSTTAPDDNLYTTSILAKNNAGTYYVWYKVVGDGNHQDYIPTSPVNVTIDQATVNLTWETTKFTYDGTDKLPTAEITAGVVGEDVCTVEVSGKQTDVNTGDSAYTATAQLTGADSDNYKIAENDKTKTFTINAKDMTVTADDVDVTYDGKEHKITVNVTDPAEGATITYKKAGDAEYSAANPAFTDSGEYDVSYKVTKANYNEFTGTATVKIKKKAVVVTPDADQNKVYGAADPQYKYSVDGLIGTETLDGTLAREPGDNAGTYAYTIGTLDSANSNYNVTLSGTSPKFEIKEKEIEIEWADTELTYNGKEQAPEASIKNKTEVLVGDDEVNITVSGQKKM